MQRYSLVLDHEFCQRVDWRDCAFLKFVPGMEGLEGERFERINGSRMSAVHREIGSLTQVSTLISTYRTKHRFLWNEFSCFVVLPSCDCPSSRAYIQHDQQQQLLQFLMGLNESKGGIRSQIMMTQMGLNESRGGIRSQLMMMSPFP